MNLFINSSLTALSALVAEHADSKDNFHVVVDYDGEVLFLGESSSIEELNKFKFYFSGIHGKKYNGILAAKDLKFLNQLYKNLIFCWENDLNGAIDFSKITSIQFNFYWLETRKANSRLESLNARTFLFSHIEQPYYTRAK